MAKSKKVYLYRSGALTGAQAAFAEQLGAEVHESYDSSHQGRCVFTRSDIQGFDACKEAELFSDLAASAQAPTNDETAEDE